MNRGKSDLYIAQAMWIQITLTGIKNILNQGVPWFYTNNSKLNLILSLVILIFYCRAFLSMRRRKITKINFSIILVILQTFLFTFILYPENVKYILVWLNYAIYYCYIPYFLLSNLRNLKYLDYYMCLSAKIIIVTAFISSFYIWSNNGQMTSKATYSMALSYPVLFATMWLIYENFFKRSSNCNKLLIILGISVICIYGSRNPLLAIITYIILILIIKALKYRKLYKRMYYLFIINIIVFFGIFYRILFEKLVYLLNSINIKSRSLDLLAVKALSSSGRDKIHSALLTTLDKNIFIGYGISGDEVILYKYGMTQSAHNLYLSLFSTYGYLIGIIVLILLVLINIIAYKKVKRNNKYILLLFMCLVWPRGFTGGDIWDSSVFWWLLGISVAILNKNFQKGVTNDKSIARDKWS